MTKETREHLSSFMDGELAPDAARFVARRLGGDEALGDTWQRYHLIRDCLRQPGEGGTMMRLRIDAARLENAPQAAPQRRWLRPFGGMAVAASVALAAVLVTLQLGQVQQAEAPQPFTSPNPLQIAPASQAASFSADMSSEQQRLNRYLMQHKQAAGAVGQQGFVSVAPFIATVPVQIVVPDTAEAALEGDEEIPAAEAAQDSETDTR